MLDCTCQVCRRAHVKLRWSGLFRSLRCVLQVHEAGSTSMACVGPGHAQTRLYGRQVVDALAQEDSAGVASDGGWGLIGRSQLVHTHLYGTEYRASGCLTGRRTRLLIRTNHSSPLPREVVELERGWGLLPLECEG